MQQLKIWMGINPGGKLREFDGNGVESAYCLSFYMGIKNHPNNKTYWHKEGCFFYCPIVSNIFTSERFQAIVNCLCTTKYANYIDDRSFLDYNKLGQIK